MTKHPKENRLRLKNPKSHLQTDFRFKFLPILLHKHAEKINTAWRDDATVRGR